MASAHDSLFKTTFSQPAEAASLLSSLLPTALAAQVDWTSLTLESPEAIDATFERRQADLLFRVRARGRDARLVVVFEHQSSVDRAMPLRLLGYMTRIWERARTEEPRSRLPVIIPVVLYHGRTKWTAPRSLRALLDVDEHLGPDVRPFVPDFSFVLDDLSVLTEAQLRNRGLSPWATMALVALAWCRNAARPERVLGRWLDVLRRVAAGSARVSALTALVTYVLRAGTGRVEPLKVVFAQLGEGAEETMLTTAEQLLRQGRREGRKAGRAQGREEGRKEGRQRIVELLSAQLTAKFGPLPANVADQLVRASEADLLRWGGQVVAASSLPDALR